MSARPLFDIPEGWRLLEVGEYHLADDVGQSKNTTFWRPLPTNCTGLPVAREDWNWYFRRIEPPKCGTCNDSRLVDSGGQNPDGSWINRDCPECASPAPVGPRPSHADLLDDFETALEKYHTCVDIRFKADIAPARAALLSRLSSLEGALDLAPIHRLGEDPLAFIERYKVWYREDRRLAIDSGKARPSAREGSV